MKKLVLLLLAGLLLAPLETVAEKYNQKKVLSMGSPFRDPTPHVIHFYLNENTGDMAITPVFDFTDLNITLTGYGVTYINTTISLNALQSYTNCLNFLSIGTYYLTISTADGLLAQYIITVEPD